MKTIFTILVVTFLSTPQVFAQSGVSQKHKILTLELKATLIEKDVVELIDGLISSELGRYPSLDIITSADMRQLAALEAEKQSMGCTTDASCLAELAGALGARLVIFGQIGKLGRNIILNLNLFDSQRASAVGRVTLRSASLDILPDQIPGAVQDLLSQFSTQIAAPPVARTSVTTQPPAPASPPPLQLAKAPPTPAPKTPKSGPVYSVSGEVVETPSKLTPILVCAGITLAGGMVAGLYGYPAYSDAYDLSATAQGFENNPNSLEAVQAHDAATSAQEGFLGGPIYGLLGGSIIALGGLGGVIYYGITPLSDADKPTPVVESPTWTD